METLEGIIAGHPFFEGLDPQFLALMVGCASNVRFNANTYVFKEGGDANEFYLIRAGKVALEVFGANRKPSIIETLGEGEVLGWSWLIAPYIWKFHARTMEMTRAIALDAKCLRAKCEENHDLGYEIMKRFASLMQRRLEATRFQLLDVYAAR